MADQYLVCRDCQSEFLFSEGEQVFYAQKGLSTPSRCPDCRQARRRQRENGELGGYSRGGGGGSRGDYGSPRPGPELFEVICAECGTTTQVPFKPRGTSPVYCRDCFAARRR